MLVSGRVGPPNQMHVFLPESWLQFLWKGQPKNGWINGCFMGIEVSRKLCPQCPLLPDFMFFFSKLLDLRDYQYLKLLFIVFNLLYIYIFTHTYISIHIYLHFLLFGLSTIGGVLNLSGQTRGWDHQQNLSCGMSGFSVILSPWLTKRRRWPFSVFLFVFFVTPGVFLWIIRGGFNIPTVVW